MKQVTVVIPNFNGCHFLETCLEALRRQTNQDFEILLVDNASTDGSVEFVRQKYPEVKIAVMENNLGFSGGVNYGIRVSETPYVILLNNDTEADSHYIEEMIKAIKKSPRIFSVSSKMVQFHNRDKMDDAGDIYTLLGWAAQRGVAQPVSEYDKPAKVFTACAGAAIYRRKVFDKIGYFDEMHFAYLEDLDIGYRAKLYGYYNAYAPKAIVYHVGSGTSGSKYNPFKVKLAARNSVYVNYKNMAGWQLLLNAFPLLCGYGIKIVFFTKLGFGRDYLEGLTEGFRTAKNCRKVSEKGRFLMFLGAEAELIKYTFVYIWEFMKRKIR